MNFKTFLTVKRKIQALEFNFYKFLFYKKLFYKFFKRLAWFFFVKNPLFFIKKQRIFTKIKDFFIKEIHQKRKEQGKILKKIQ